ncbi:PssE/Cps14G family polysaccharide biosynthesis glycosyltransferase [Salegentibacter mishustinae]|jgi:UDP-N-acetylglucosamine transferase subunit ALG13|uniref:PssE/Cps14G family polysaccharide biosynthesis glycosyltransferase n=1 Tax=Salegentibacter mishustinae TaxID=270918 RepID=UPI00249005C2|nr:PssE/Cps14G family polysaccharide biosynthesis glycosyltransferase [Salegentibacter mishustinae]MDX1426710.1 PssE/Cps14G family polysaccharide biosynthesis glycosyltransferase [Salegentibacter mishustinae]
MIIVLLGTFPTAFKRPLIEIEKLCKKGLITEEVIVQSGHTQFDSEYMKMRPFISPDELTELYKQARVVITQAGTGSLIKGMKLNKKIIAIPRLAKYGEVVDDHQEEILHEFTKQNYILPWTEDIALEEVLSKIDDFKPSPYVSTKQNIIDHLEGYINSL